MEEDTDANGRGVGLLKGSGKKKAMEWDLNDWRWDGDLFIATPVNTSSFDCGDKRGFPVRGASTSSSDDNDESEIEKRRKVSYLDNSELNEEAEAGQLALKLGEQDLGCGNGIEDEKKGGRIQGVGVSSRGMCQVDGCGADLHYAKDYHRRHKVCELHAKANKALIGNVIQRFCQQCSRFHLLKEFDEGKRSCRRRLAGHNKRRRKSSVDAAVSESPTNLQSNSFLLTSLLMILSSFQAKSNEQLKDQDLLSHFLRNLAKFAGTFDSRHLSTLLQASQDPKGFENSAGVSSDAARCVYSNNIISQQSLKPSCPQSTTNHNIELCDSNVKPANETTCSDLPAMEFPKKGSTMSCALDSTIERIEATGKKNGLLDFDLNDVYYDEHEMNETKALSRKNGTTSVNHPWMLQEYHHSESLPQATNGQLDSASVHSFANSNGQVRGHTDRIAFKIFGKDPNDFPVTLREQILGWLANSPTDIESYIKPGCIILTVYLRLSESTWDELYINLGSSLKRLLDLDDNNFWRTGWLYARVRHQMAFVCNGQVVLDAPLHGVNDKHTKLSVTPIAVSVATTVKFTIKCCNLAWSSMRFLCAFQGKYLVQEAATDLVSSVSVGNLNDGLQVFSFSCSLPDAIGRGFIEVEDHILGGASIPFIVAEPEVCSEVCMLEDVIDAEDHIHEKLVRVEARDQAVYFLHEMGWLLQRCQLWCRSPENIEHHSDGFPLKRFKRLIDFSMDHEWCAVVSKLLNILIGGYVDTGGLSVEHTLEEMSLLHDAVLKNSRLMIEFLLFYVPNNHIEIKKPEMAKVGRVSSNFLFRADMTNTKKQTALHVAASRGDTEAVLDALTNDPLQVGIAAWKSARDSVGLTPEDHARSNGYTAYMNLVDNKLKKESGARNLVLEIPEASTTSHGTDKRKDYNRSTTFEINKGKSGRVQQPYCNLCSRQQLVYVKKNRSALVYRPAVLSLFGIAAVCICVSVILKSLPEVHYVRYPFRWDAVAFGII